MYLEISDPVKNRTCIFKFMHNWVTVKEGKYKPKKEYFRHTRERKNTTLYQECSKCKTRRLFYKGDWKELSSFDTSYFITRNYETWLKNQFPNTKGELKDG